MTPQEQAVFNAQNYLSREEWAHVRNHILEEAAKACYIAGIPIDPGSCAKRIRAMKGTP